MQITDYQSHYFAQELTIRSAESGVDRLSQSLFDASVDLNPHQIQAALFALQNPLSKGVVLADEVGLGKTIEAGLVLSQYWAERKRRLLIICPAALRKQWAQELSDKFNLPATVLDAKTWRSRQSAGEVDPLSTNSILVMSYHYAVRIAEELMLSPWDLVVIDEAHKLRNAHKTGNRMGQALRMALGNRKKLLLTATPLQNSLMELYGLSTIIDEQLFGDERSFRDQFVNGSAYNELKNRLAGFVQRTLRKDVLEYVRYTQRQTITVPFTPSVQEQQLYECITALLEKDDSYALPRNQRHLTGLILRKLAASSSRAVLFTLSTIKDRLEDLYAGVIPDQSIADKLLESDDFEQDFQEESFDDTSSAQDEDIDPEALKVEIGELEHYIRLAAAIESDQKAEALLTALTQGFERMAQMGAQEKAIIFTESRRTQEYLQEFLSQHGFAGRLVTFSGTNNSPEATQVYQQWLKDNHGSDRVTGSPQVDRRTALIDYFKRDDGLGADIMIATEAAAEGVNLQFCSLLINYDLPWNPQRVEQRIGRCHRYGQKFDVVVINFLNEKNEADRRVLELLTEKFQLFDGVFGASDEVLGSIESGVDFEKRIQNIYETCREAAEIEAAFNRLRQDMEAEINQKMLETRQLLLENFDEDIHDLMKIQLDQAQQRLDKISRWFWAMTHHELNGLAAFDDDTYSFSLAESLAESPAGQYQLVRRGTKLQDDEKPANAHIYRLTHPLGQQLIEQALSRELPWGYVEFDYSHHDGKISALEPYMGRSGLLTLQKFSVDSLERSEDHLIFAAVTDSGEIMPAEVAQKLMALAARSLPASGVNEAGTLEQQISSQLQQQRQDVERNINDRNLSFFEQEVSKLDHWADDLKEGLEYDIKELDKAIKQTRRDAKIAATLEEKLALQKQQRDLEKQRNNARRELFDRQDEVDERREALIESLESKLNKQTQTTDLFSIHWQLV